MFFINFRWLNRANNGFAHIADDVKCRLRRIAHANSQVQLESAIHDLRQWEHFDEKLKRWMEGKCAQLQFVNTEQAVYVVYRQIYGHLSYYL